MRTTITLLQLSLVCYYVVTLSVIFMGKYVEVRKIIVWQCSHSKDFITHLISLTEYLALTNLDFTEKSTLSKAADLNSGELIQMFHNKPMCKSTQRNSNRLTCRMLPNQLLSYINPIYQNLIVRSNPVSFLRIL